MRKRLVAALLLLVALSFETASAQDQAPRDVTPLARAVVSQMVAQDFAKVWAQFGAQMKAAMNEDRLRTTWVGMAAQTGAFKQVTAARMELRGAYRAGIVTCEFERAAVDITVVFDAADAIAGLNMRPAQPPVAPYAAPSYADATKYTEADVTVDTTDWPLPGTLTMPVGAGPFPAIVLVHGSGPNDRDETLGPNKPFKDLALGLASRGIAVLRYEKRTKQYGARLDAIDRFTVKDEAIDDALAAVAVLRKTARINPSKIVVAGHSLGGMLVPRIGAADPQISGLISLAGAARSLDQAILQQTRYLVEADGTISPDEQKAIDDAQKLAAAVAALTPANAADKKSISGAPASYWLDLRGYDPPVAAKSLTQPLLVLQGERDYQVTMVDDFAKWKAALSGKRTVTFHTYPALNHLFLAGTGKSLPAEYSTPGHVAIDVINDIVVWIASLK